MGKGDREEKEDSRGEAAKLVTSEGTWGSVVLGREPQGQGGNHLNVSQPEAGDSGHVSPSCPGTSAEGCSEEHWLSGTACLPAARADVHAAGKTDKHSPACKGRGLQ